MAYFNQICQIIFVLFILLFVLYVKRLDIKGTVARDCQPLVFFMNRPHMGL
jgi:hypothetical protein